MSEYDEQQQMNTEHPVRILGEKCHSTGEIMEKDVME